MELSNTYFKSSTGSIYYLIQGVITMRNKMQYLDYAIMKTVNDSEDPLWKKKIYEQICSNNGTLPALDSVSVQTVGRYVDEMVENGLVDTTLTNPEDLSRSFIVAYNLTERGEQALDEKRETILKEKVVESASGILEPFEDTDLEKSAVIALMEDEFDLTEDMVEFLETEFAPREVMTLLAMYYFNNQLMQGMNEDNVERQLKFILNTPKFRDSLMSASYTDIIRTGLQQIAGDRSLRIPFRNLFTESDREPVEDCPETCTC